MGRGIKRNVMFVGMYYPKEASISGRAKFRSGGGGGAEVSCRNILTIACTKIKWFLPNITSCFLGGCSPPPPPPPQPHGPYAYRGEDCTLTQGRIQDLKKGVAQHTVFFGPPPASKVAQVLKKLMSGGTPTLFFRSATSVESRASPKRRGGGGNPTHYCVPTHLCFCSFVF